MSPRIRTSHIFPPIPTRQFDWMAWYEDVGEEACEYGYGHSEEEAIKDLKDNWDEP